MKISKAASPGGGRKVGGKSGRRRGWREEIEYGWKEWRGGVGEFLRSVRSPLLSKLVSYLFMETVVYRARWKKDFSSHRVVMEIHYTSVVTTDFRARFHIGISISLISCTFFFILFSNVFRWKQFYFTALFFFPPFRFVRYRREFISLRSNECWTEMGEEMGGKLSIFWLEDDRDGRSILKKTKSLVLYRKLYRDSKIVGIKTGVV